MRRLVIALMAVVMALAATPSVTEAASKPAAPRISVSTERGAATLSWASVPNAGGYNVYRNGKYLKTVSKSPYRDGNRPGTYTYYVTAFDRTKKHFSSRSNELRADTRGSSGSTGGSISPSNTGRLSAPNLKRIDTVRGGATLHFDHVAGAAGYNVYRNGKYLKTVSKSPYRDGNRPGIYTYYVTAFDRSKKKFSPKSRELKADTSGNSTSGDSTQSTPVTPAQPAGSGSLVPPTMTKVETGSGYAKFWFDSVPGAAGYNVYRNGKYLQTIKASPYRDGNRAGTYTYEFVSFDSSKKKFSSKSEPVNVDTRSSSSTTPQKPSDRGSNTNASSNELGAPFLKRIGTLRGEATLHFDEVPRAAGYNVYRNGKYLTTITSSPYRDKNTPGAYTYHLTAFDSSKEIFSPKSNQIKADTRGNTSTAANADDAPDGSGSLRAPQIIHALTTGRFVEIKWNRVQGAVGVNVNRNGKYIGSVNFPDNVFNDSSGKAGDTYTLVAYAGDVFSPKSASQVVGTQAQSQLAVSFKITDKGQVVMTWNAPANRRFRIWRSTSGSYNPLSGRVVKSMGFSEQRGARGYVDQRTSFGATYLVQEMDRDGTVVAASRVIRPAYIETPRAVGAIRTAGDRVAIGWAADDTEGVTSWRVFRDGRFLDSSPSAIFIDTSAVPGRSHKFQIQPVIGSSYGPLSLAVQVPAAVDADSVVVAHDDSRAGPAAVQLAGQAVLDEYEFNAYDFITGAAEAEDLIDVLPSLRVITARIMMVMVFGGGSYDDAMRQFPDVTNEFLAQAQSTYRLPPLRPRGDSVRKEIDLYVEIARAVRERERTNGASLSAAQMKALIETTIRSYQAKNPWYKPTRVSAGGSSEECNNSLTCHNDPLPGETDKVEDFSGGAQGQPGEIAGDMDGDGIPNTVDPDRDGDGVPNDRDPAPNNYNPPAPPGSGGDGGGDGGSTTTNGIDISKLDDKGTTNTNTDECGSNGCP